MRHVTVQVDGHDPVTEHYVETDDEGARVAEGFRLVCPCGEVGDLRENVLQANEDRFEHEDAVGMRVPVTDDE